MKIVLLVSFKGNDEKILKVIIYKFNTICILKIVHLISSYAWKRSNVKVKQAGVVSIITSEFF